MADLWPLCKERGYTQVELVDKIRILQTLITDYECDRLRLSTGNGHPLRSGLGDQPG